MLRVTINNCHQCCCANVLAKVTIDAKYSINENDRQYLRKYQELVVNTRTVTINNTVTITRTFTLNVAGFDCTVVVLLMLAVYVYDSNTIRVVVVGA